MQQHTVRGAFRELKGQILNTWETLADEELEKAKENMTQLSNVFQEKMDRTKEQVSEKVNQFLVRFNVGFEPNKKTSSPKRKVSPSNKSFTPHN